MARNSTADADDGDDDLQTQGKPKKGGGLFGRKSKAAKPPKGGDAWPPPEQPAAGGFGAGGFGGAAGLGGGPSSFGALDPGAPISIRMGGAPVEKTRSEPDALVDPNSINRGGGLTTTAGGSSKKMRWLVLGGGHLAVYSDKKDAAAAKPPKCTIDLRADVSRVVCDSLNSFKIVLATDVRDGGKSAKGKPIHKAGESLVFSLDDSRELTAWANDLTNVHKALQVGR